ncbi:hypothetical protein FPV67DRAFT_1543929 [Lyophyllum atratum]|nr:hypothetical protein FPV67DRAFT_1543929 [Lyophyllum atratum]
MAFGNVFALVPLVTELITPLLLFHEFTLQCARYSMRNISSSPQGITSLCNFIAFLDLLDAWMTGGTQIPRTTVTPFPEV